MTIAQASLEFWLLVPLTLAAVYCVAWIASRAYFANKAEYNRKLLRELEEKSDEEA